MADTADWKPARVFQADTGSVPVRPRLGFADILTVFWRAKGLMALAAALVLIFGWVFSATSPKHAIATASLYVSGAGDAAPPEQVALEAELFESKAVAQTVRARFPADRIAQSEAQFSASLTAKVAGAAPILDVAYRGAERGLAGEVLNAAIAAYLAEREAFFAPADTADKPDLPSPTRLLLEAEDALRAFLQTHEIGDFTRELSAARGLEQALSQQVAAHGVTRTALAAERRVLKDRLSQTAEQIDLSVDDTLAAQLQLLELERTRALISFLPESQRVQTIEAQMAALQAEIESRDAPDGPRRIGPNPVHQALQARLFEVEASLAAKTEARRDVQQRLSAVTVRLEVLQSLQPEWQELKRARDAAALAAQRVEATPQQGAGFTVRLMDPVNVSTRTATLGPYFWPLIALSALIAALVSGWLRIAQTKTLPSPTALQRTTGLSVLAVMNRK